jgi:hypothetical protein
MKTILTIAITLAMMAAFAVPMVLAEDNETGDINDNSDAISLYDDTSNLSEGLVISPAPTTDTVSAETEAELELNESAGGGKIAWKQFKLWFTFNQERKIQGELELAKLRLIQAKIAAENNNSEAMEKALEAHERIMNRIQNRMDKLDGDSSFEGLNASAIRLVGLERAIQVHERRIAYLSNVLANANLTDEQRAKIETKLGKMQDRVGNLTAIQERKMTQIKTKLMAVGNLSEDDANEMVQGRHDKIENRVEQRLENREERRNETRNNSHSDDSEDNETGDVSDDSALDDSNETESED